jgi:hypothetical protein
MADGNPADGIKRYTPPVHRSNPPSSFAFASLSTSLAASCHFSIRGGRACRESYSERTNDWSFARFLVRGPRAACLRFGPFIARYYMFITSEYSHL